MKKWNVVLHCGMLTRTIIPTHRHTDRKGEEDREKKMSQKKYLRTCTSILRPSTTVPCNFSLALSASTLCSNVTNPKPCMQERKRRGSGGRGGGRGSGRKSTSVSLKHTISKYFTIQAATALSQLIRQRQRNQENTLKTPAEKPAPPGNEVTWPSVVEQEHCRSECRKPPVELLVHKVQRSASIVPYVTARQCEVQVGQNHTKTQLQSQLAYSHLTYTRSRGLGMKEPLQRRQTGQWRRRREWGCGGAAVTWSRAENIQANQFHSRGVTRAREKSQVASAAGASKTDEGRASLMFGARDPKRKIWCLLRRPGWGKHVAKKWISMQSFECHFVYCCNICWRKLYHVNI